MLGAKLLQEEDDGLEMRESGPWVCDKYYYLIRYIDIFETSMRGKWENRAYIDLFSGPGKCIEKSTQSIHFGSPLLALTTRYPFSEYYFVDKSKFNIDSLMKRCNSFNNKVRISSYIGDSNKLVDEIISQIDFAKSINLSFLDPEGLDLHWETVVKLSSVTRMDLIIFYPQMGLTRQMPNEVQNDSNTNIDKFFGSRKWREIYTAFNIREELYLHRKLLDLYKNNLQRLGYQDTKSDEEVGIEPLMVNTREAPLYRLIFASKSQLGHEFWKKITKKNHRGQRRLF